jgi:hypothetical protein
VVISQAGGHISDWLPAEFHADTSTTTWNWFTTGVCLRKYAVSLMVDKSRSAKPASSAMAWEHSLRLTKYTPATSKLFPVVALFYEKRIKVGDWRYYPAYTQASSSSKKDKTQMKKAQIAFLIGTLFGAAALPVSMYAQPKPATKMMSMAPSQSDIDAAKAAGKVWCNTSTKVYHVAGDKYYGTTKHGKFMTTDEAKTANCRAAKMSPIGKKKTSSK